MLEYHAARCAIANTRPNGKHVLGTQRIKLMLIKRVLQRLKIRIRDDT
jgi:hypothetical protein